MLHLILYSCIISLFNVRECFLCSHDVPLYVSQSEMTVVLLIEGIGWVSHHSLSILTVLLCFFVSECPARIPAAVQRMLLVQPQRRVDIMESRPAMKSSNGDRVSSWVVGQDPNEPRAAGYYCINDCFECLCTRGNPKRAISSLCCGA